MDGEALAAAGVESPWCPSRRTIAPVRRTRRPRAISGIGLQLGTSTVRPHTSTRARSPSVGRLGRPLRGPTKSEYPPAGVGAIVGAASRARREQLRGSIPLPTPTPPDTSRNRPAGAKVEAPRNRRHRGARSNRTHRGARLPRIRHAIISFGLPYEPEAEIRSNERAASEQDALPTSRLCSSVCGINTTGRSQGTGQVSRVLYKRR